jgi:hypothetical protein
MASSEHELSELVARINVIYTRRGLSPPSRLRDAARDWTGLPPETLVDLVDEHLDKWRHEYRSGSGDRCFPMIVAAVGKLLDPCPPLSVEPVQPRRGARSQRGRVKKLYQGAGFTDAFDDSDAPWIHRTSPPLCERIVPLNGELEDENHDPQG